MPPFGIVERLHLRFGLQHAQNTVFSGYMNTKGVHSAQAMERVSSFDNPFLLKSPNAGQPPKAQPGHPQIQHLQFKMQSEANDAC